MDKVFIKDLRVTGIIGIYEHERTTPQEMVINATMLTDIRRAAETDAIADCVNYEQVANRLREHAKTAQRMTVEALAEDLARICLETPGVRGVTIRVEKTEAIADTGAVGVEISREKVDLRLARAPHKHRGGSRRAILQSPQSGLSRLQVASCARPDVHVRAMPKQRKYLSDRD